MKSLSFFWSICSVPFSFGKCLLFCGCIGGINEHFEHLRGKKTNEFLNTFVYCGAVWANANACLKLCPAGQTHSSVFGIVIQFFHQASHQHLWAKDLAVNYGSLRQFNHRDECPNWLTIWTIKDISIVLDVSFIGCWYYWQQVVKNVDILLARCAKTPLFRVKQTVTEFWATLECFLLHT